MSWIPNFRACEKNNYDMVLTFIRFDFDIKILPEEGEEGISGEWFPLIRMMRERLIRDDNENDDLRNFRLFYASTKPAYLIGKPSPNTLYCSADEGIIIFFSKISN